jgi:tRNA A58 N-methylase Trm61
VGSSDEPVAGESSRLAALEARVERLETALEDLQDALYRQAVAHDKELRDLRARTAPEQVARDLSADARKRGL